MKPTHWTRTEITAWQYKPNAPMPVWVARKFHNLGNGEKLTARIGESLVDVMPGDWIAVMDVAGIPTYGVSTDEEFRKNFTPIEP